MDALNILVSRISSGVEYSPVVKSPGQKFMSLKWSDTLHFIISLKSSLHYALELFFFSGGFGKKKS